VRGPMKEACVLDHPIPAYPGGDRVRAVTEFTPLGHFERWSLIKVRPLTGRLHQIRRHLKHLSHPIVGDVRYGKGEINRMFRESYGLHRLCLHAYKLTVNHPKHGFKLTVTAAPDDEFGQTLARMGLAVHESN
ncbi:MAG TPA: pseudouridine synthase, partial [Candidatus Obscuribacterales bacterium]